MRSYSPILKGTLMKNFIGAIFFMLLSASAFANPILNCRSTRSNLEATIVVDRERSPDNPDYRLILSINGETSYDLLATKRVDEPDHQTFFTGTFTNRRGAPSRLKLEIFNADGGWLGNLTEENFMPEIGGFEVDCSATPQNSN
jgi:hypothetical protein